MADADATDSTPLVSQNGGEAVVKTEAVVVSSTPIPQGAANALLPDKTAQVPKFLACLASEAKLNEAAIKAAFPTESKE